MRLTKENMRLFAAKYYDNPFCLTEAEFDSDVFKSSIIKKMLTAYQMEKQANLQMLVNMVISFYNVFDHKAATDMLKAKLNEDQYELINSILVFLSYPLIEEFRFDNSFLIKIRELYQ